MSELPPGFVLDQPDTGLPPGFVLDGTGIAEDAAKSVGAGLGNAAIGTLGGLGDLRSLASAGVDTLGSKLGADLSPLKTAASAASKVLPGLGLIANAPTSQQVRSTVTDPIVDPDYKPQSALGGVLKTGAEFAPNMLVGGPEGLGARFLTNVAAPALASEGAGALTKGTDAEPYARAAAALLGGAGAGKIANSMAEARAIKAATPALADVKGEASNAYDALTSRNVATPLQQSTLDNLASDITTTLNNRGIRPSNAGSIHAAVDEIKTPATAGAADVADLVAGRHSIKELLTKPDTNKAGAFVALQKIEKAIEQASPGAMKDIREADKNWAAFRANEALDKRTAKAELRASSTDSGMNVGNKIRQNVATYLGSNDAKYLSAETKADLEKIVKGTWTQNGMRAVANLLGGGGGLGMLAGGTAGYEAGGWPGALGGAALGRGFKMANNRSILKQTERVAQNIRLRSPLGQSSPLVLPPMSNPALSGLLPALLSKPKQ